MSLLFQAKVQSGRSETRKNLLDPDDVRTSERRLCGCDVIHSLPLHLLPHAQKFTFVRQPLPSIGQTSETKQQAKEDQPQSQMERSQKTAVILEREMEKPTEAPEAGASARLRKDGEKRTCLNSEGLPWWLSQ